MTTEPIPADLGGNDLNPLEAEIRDALAAEPSPEIQAEHLRLIQDTIARLQTHVGELRWHAEVTNDRLAHLETRKPKADYEATRRELKARCLADALLDHLVLEFSASAFGDVIGIAIADVEDVREIVGWPTLLAAVNADRPDPFGPPSDATKALVLQILRQRAEQF